MSPLPAVRRARRRRASSSPELFAAIAALLALVLFGSGCATTRAYQREHLSDRIMTFDGDAKETARRAKSLDAREGSTGGTGGAGGGCACN